ncbi:hypothetical protein SAMN02745119_01023 [Trichlorobacter thiogenes]|uniref:Porin n=1 Tax=Trichlorobacter thiogenes TaxID=115783 RepID=A0A1T4LSF0_9BACT|nr:hypothetical protein [Trichlorobacter thiogenes]SJZ57384.1 hypothetical protein SAMN02745119_01023 [Trichlorobacter thiogenes]
MKKRIISASIIAAALGLSVPAMALDVTPYGAIRVGTWWTSSTYYNGQNALHDADFTLDLQGDSLVGMRVKEGDFSGIAEMGAYNPKNRAGGVELRMLFGEWDFGGGKVRVGYAPSPYVFRSEQTYDSDGGFNGYGSLWDGRYAQIKASLNNGLYLTLKKQSTSNTGGTSNFTTNTGPAWQNTPFNLTATQYAATNTNYDTYLPQTTVGYEGKAGILKYGGGMAFNFYKVTQTTSDVVTSKDEIYSYLGFAHGTVDLAPVELKFNLYTGQNVGNLMANSGAATGSYYFNRHNAYTYGGWAQVGYTLNNKIKMFTGASYESNDTKESKVDDRMAAFANLQYAVSKNFKIVPEFTYLNDLRSRTGAKEPQIYAAGVKWEMTF